MWADIFKVQREREKKNIQQESCIRLNCPSRVREIPPFATAWIEMESIMLSEISQVVRDKYHMISPLTGT